MMDIDNKNYAALRAVLDEIAVVKKASDDSFAALVERIEEHFPDECAGSCEGCGKLLLYGDKGWRYDDGPICCSECSPTWAEGKDGFEHSDDAEVRTSFEKRLAEHLAAGGALDAQMPLMEI